MVDDLSGCLRIGVRRQQPSYPDPQATAEVVNQLRSLPPLVFAGECDDLRAYLAAVA
ncbi:MAG: 3-deoxy-7-phosphoheptulonate synthase, partial [Cutibacterium acnes]|nr:3-deoxy-7-phosphoheptulonate synthase [Cutibacterium acnes]